jgi:hypothetical protein
MPEDALKVMVGNTKTRASLIIKLNWIHTPDDLLIEVN